MRSPRPPPFLPFPQRPALLLQGIVASNIQELLVEPRRGVVPLDYEFRVEEVGGRGALGGLGVF